MNTYECPYEGTISKIYFKIPHVPQNGTEFYYEVVDAIKVLFIDEEDCEYVDGGEHHDFLVVTTNKLPLAELIASMRARITATFNEQLALL